MRTRMIVLSGVLLVASASFAQAQDTTPANSPAPAASAVPTVAPQLGTIDFGFRGDSFTGDQARYNRLRDLQDGAYLDRFRYSKETESQYFRAEAYRVGYEDQRYLVRFDEVGKFRATFDYNSNPLYQAQASNLFTHTGNGIATVSDTVQAGLQNGSLTQLQAMQQYALPSDIKTQRDTANFNAIYSASKELDLKVNVRNTMRSGNNLQSFVFGSSPGNAVVLDQGVPVSDRTTNVKTQAEWANREAMLAIGYNVSWYNQNDPSFQWDNPLRLTDSATAGPAFGRTSLWPTNSANTFNVTGSAKLAGHSRVMAALSYGTWDQNQALLPNTTNTLLLSNPLERQTAEAKADITSGILGFSSRPLRDLFFTAKYRYYDYANKTPVFTNTATVADYAAGTLEESEPASIKRQTFDVDTSYSPFKYLGFDAGYSRENDDRTFRVVPHSSEDMFRVSADSTGNQYVTARVKYEYSKRRGTLDPSALPDSEQSQMVQYDVAPRDRNRTTVLVTITPVTVFDINGTVFTGHDSYPDTYFGLRDNKNDGYTFGVDYVPNAKFSAGANYGRENNTAFQWSRTANPLSATDVTFNDPRRDWNLTTADKVDTYTVYIDCPKMIAKTDIRLSYDLTDGHSNQDYGVVPNSTLPAPVQYTLQPRNKIQVAKLDGKYYIRPNVALGAAIWYEEYSVQDFAFDPAALAPQALPFALYTGYTYAPYKATTGFVRMTYLW
jgi:MtrB/PioB family decaheme-associated outer membrane protein